MGWFVLRAGPAAAPLQLSFRPAGGAIIGRQKGVTFESKLTHAHFERRLISERTKDGLATVRKHGRTPGRPPLQPETISALQDLVEAGKSVSQAAKHLGIGRSTAYRVIRNADQ